MSIRKYTGKYCPSRPFWEQSVDQQPYEQVESYHTSLQTQVAISVPRVQEYVIIVYWTLGLGIRLRDVYEEAASLLASRTKV